MESLTKHQFTAISIHSSVTGTPEHILEWLTLSMDRPPANRLVSQENEQGQQTNVIFGPPHSNASAQYDPITYTWKTCQDLSTADISAQSWETWPKAGIVFDGKFYQQPKLARRIKEVDYGLLPTPTNNDPELERRKGDVVITKTGSVRAKSKNGKSTSYLGLSHYVQTWATPQHRDFRTGERHRYENPKRSNNLNDQVGGKLNPDWVDALMGFPVGLTSLNPLNSDDFQEWVCGFYNSLYENSIDCQTSKYGVLAWQQSNWEQNIPKH